MAYTIISESYGPRKPKIICTADSLDDLAGLDCAEGSEATVGETTYVLDRVNGWVEPGGGGGGSLPEVSEDDNGDVLTVVDGAWGKAAPSGGGPLVVNVDYEYHETYETYTCDKTFAEIYAAGSAGSAVFVYKIFGSDCMDYVLHMYTNGQNDNFIFVGTFRDDGNGYIVFKTLQYDAMTENDYPVCTVTLGSEPSEP